MRNKKQQLPFEQGVIWSAAFLSNEGDPTMANQMLAEAGIMSPKQARDLGAEEYYIQLIKEWPNGERFYKDSD